MAKFRREIRSPRSSLLSPLRLPLCFPTLVYAPRDSSWTQRQGRECAPSCPQKAVCGPLRCYRSCLVCPSWGPFGEPSLAFRSSTRRYDSPYTQTATTYDGQITSASPVTALIASRSPLTSFVAVHLDGTVDWMVAQRRALLAWTGQTLRIFPTINTKFVRLEREWLLHWLRSIESCPLGQLARHRSRAVGTSWQRPGLPDQSEDRRAVCGAS